MINGARSISPRKDVYMLKKGMKAVRRNAAIWGVYIFIIVILALLVPQQKQELEGTAQNIAVAGMVWGILSQLLSYNISVEKVLEKKRLGDRFDEEYFEQFWGHFSISVQLLKGIESLVVVLYPSFASFFNWDKLTYIGLGILVIILGAIFWVVCYILLVYKINSWRTIYNLINKKGREFSIDSTE
jgi:hypothetical protein